MTRRRPHAAPGSADAIVDAVLAVDLDAPGLPLVRLPRPTAEAIDEALADQDAALDEALAWHAFTDEEEAIIRGMP